MIGYDQRVSQPDNWLHDGAEENRQFVKVIHLPIGQEWHECTDAEKVAWEEEHKPAEPEQPEEAKVVTE